MNIDTERFIVFRCRPVGLGHIVGTLLQLLYLSDELDRIPAFDLRESNYFRDDPHREFFECFGFCAPADKEIVTDITAIDQLYASADTECRGRFAPWGFVRRSDARIVVIDGSHVSNVLNAAKKPVPPIYRIEPHGSFAELVAEGLPPKAPDEHWVGLHFRHGNGEFLSLRFDVNVTPDYSVRYEEVKRHYVDVARAVGKARFHDRTKYYIASDSTDFISYCRAHLPGAVVRGDKGIDGHWEVLARSGDGRRALLEATQDMWNLSRCDFLIHGESLLATSAIINSKTMGGADTFEVSLPSLRTLISNASEDDAVRIARSVFQRLVEKSPHLGPATADGVSLMLRTRGMAAESQWFRQHGEWIKALNADPSIARARKVNGAHPIAVRSLPEAVPALTGNPHYHMFCASVFEAAGDPRSADDALETAEQLDPETPGLLIARGRINLALGESRAALESAAVALGRFGNEERCRHQIASILEGLAVHDSW
jgi:hypothetical protein